MPKIHITSLLLPRVAATTHNSKSVAPPNSAAIGGATTAASELASSSAIGDIVVYSAETINIELIPTLQFENRIPATPPPSTSPAPPPPPPPPPLPTSLPHHCLNACCTRKNSSPSIEQALGDTSLSSIDLSDLLHSTEFSTFTVSEMDPSAAAPTTATPSTSDAQADTAPTTTNTNDQDNAHSVQEPVENIVTASSSLTEDIEEELEASLVWSDDEVAEEPLDFSPGPSKKPSAPAAAQDELFGIVLSDASASEHSSLSLSMPHSDNSHDEPLKLSDNQLSGHNLAQHFVASEQEEKAETAEEEDEDALSLSVARDQPLDATTDTENSFEANAKPSLGNQSTSDDISDIPDEQGDEVLEDSLLSDGNTQNAANSLPLEETESSLEPFPSIPILNIPAGQESEDDKLQQLSETEINAIKSSASSLVVSIESQAKEAVEKILQKDIAMEKSSSPSGVPSLAQISQKYLDNAATPKNISEQSLSLKDSQDALSKALDILEVAKNFPHHAVAGVHANDALSYPKALDVVESARNLSEPSMTGQNSNESPTYAKALDVLEVARNYSQHSMAREASALPEQSVAGKLSKDSLSDFKVLDILEVAKDLPKQSTTIEVLKPADLKNVEAKKHVPLPTMIIEASKKPSIASHSKSFEDPESTKHLLEQAFAIAALSPTAAAKEKTTAAATAPKGNVPQSTPGAGPLEYRTSLANLPPLMLSKSSAAASKPIMPELFENPNIRPLSGASSLHSDLDQSIEEMIEANRSADLTLDDDEISSLTESFVFNNQTYISRLLTNSPASDVEAAYEGKPNGALLPANNAAKALEQAAQIQHRLQYAAEYVERLEFQQMESCGELVGKTLHSDIVTDLDDMAPDEGPEAAPSKPQEQLNNTKVESPDVNAAAASKHEESEDDEDAQEGLSLQLMKLRLLAMQCVNKDSPLSPSGEAAPTTEFAPNKLMERVVLVEYNKEMLEDITEESERTSLSTQEEPSSMNLEKSSSAAMGPQRESKASVQSHSEMDSCPSNLVVSLSMIQMLEQKVGELQQVVASKDACLASLNMQLEQSQRENSRRESSDAAMGSGRESSSLITNSTEYRTLQEDFASSDIYMELTKRDELIAKLTDSLQQSLVIRENLQSESEKLSTEVLLLRKQLADALDTLKRPCWPRIDQESNSGQRISEISMDLVSESDEDLERYYYTDNEERFSRNSRERQLSLPRQNDVPPSEGGDLLETSTFSKQIEQFQKYLTPSEVRLFFMVQKKFDDYMLQELEKTKMKSEQELKQATEHWESQNREKDEEIKRLLSQKQERELKHNQEMEDLRKYFETKCADLEKHMPSSETHGSEKFSDDVFSQQSQRRATSSPDSSDHELYQLEYKPSTFIRSNESSPKKRSRAELLLSPSHRQMTPGHEETPANNEGTQLALEITELKRFYQAKMQEIRLSQKERIQKLTDRLKYYETNYPPLFESTVLDSTVCDSSAENEEATQIPKIECDAQSDETLVEPEIERREADDNRLALMPRSASPPTPLIAPTCNNNNSSLIMVDMDELNSSNETQIIQKITDEYDRRLQEQLALAREDIVQELEKQIHILLEDPTGDDQNWPKELILLREKLTAKSQLEIAQLQLKHAEEMSRLKFEYDKMLYRKQMRHSVFDAARDVDKLQQECDTLRELSNTFRQVLAELLKCVATCENDIAESLMMEVQRLLSCNRTMEEQTLEDYSFNGTMLNDTLSTTKLRLIPDVHNLIDAIEDPNLVKYITQRRSEDDDDIDLKECLERLRNEALYLLQLSEDQKKKHNDKDCYSSETEKNDSCCEQEDGLRLQQGRKFIRVNSLNEQQLTTHSSAHPPAHAQKMISLPPDINTIFGADHSSNSSNAGVNAAELRSQLTELQNRLVKSEDNRLKLQQELDLTISRNSDLGQELQHLRQQLSQMSSPNHTEYSEGYGLATSMKSPRLSAADAPACGFAQLQERARSILSTPTQQQSPNDTTLQLVQMIEDFCREGDKVVACSKKDREDLEAQIQTADKQLKSIRQFLEEQAIEREQEREEFLRELERHKEQLREKDKELSSQANASEEVEHLESQIRELTQQLKDSNAKKDNFEVELKAYLDKTYVLREIISDLENQIATKAVEQKVMEEKVKHLEDYINSQNHCNEALQMEIQALKSEIEHGYQMRIKQLEDKLQNIRPPAEQSLIMDQVVEQLRDIEASLDQKTKTLESLHHSTASSVGSLSCPEDVSARGPGPSAQQNLASASSQNSPVHPSPRQHSLTMEGVQRVGEKLAKHTRIEEAAIKRIRDLEMQVTQMKAACVELQYERESLQERMSEQTQRISALQSRLEEQRQRAEELQRANTSDLTIRIHDLQSDLQNTRETLTNRDKQIATLKQQLEKSKVVIDRLEAELAVEQQPDRSIVERLENDIKLKQAENQRLKDKIKNEMINRLALPDLMETMLADKNEEIDHLKEQLEAKEKQLHSTLEMTQNSSRSKPAQTLSKLTSGQLSDIASISELDEPDVVRRAELRNVSSPLVLPAGAEGFLHNNSDSSKMAVADLTHKRTEDLSGFTLLQPANTFDFQNYFQDPNTLGSSQSGAIVTPNLVPRQINFSDMTEDSKLKTPLVYQTPENKQRSEDKTRIETLEQQVQQLKQQLEAQEEANCQQIRKLQQEIAEKTQEISQLERAQDKWQQEKTELLSKHEKNMKNLQDSEEMYRKRMQQLEENLLQSTENEVKERENLRKELRVVSEAHEQCKYVVRDSENRKREIENLNQEIKAKDERLLGLTAKLSIAEDTVAELQRQVLGLEREMEKLKQQSSDNSSRQFSVDEVAQQIEKELNYSAQLDSNILKAIESEEENNLDRSHVQKNVHTDVGTGTTDDENFTGERDLLNKLEALRAQIAVEREHAEQIRQELTQEKQHSHDVQEQDVVIMEAMRKRLEVAMEQEDELRKQLDNERDRCERLQTQLVTLQRTESRRNSSLLKSPTESPRKSPRSLTDFESELAERLRSEIKLLTAQNERERERSMDLQKSGERERTRYEKELLERVEYCEKLKREMEKVARDKDSAEIEIEHLQERLMLQTQEIESLEARIGSLQEAETRRCARKEKHQKENAQLMAEMQELKMQLGALEAEKESLNKCITQLRFDVERSAHRESKLAEALSNANAQMAAREGTSTVPEQFLQKMKEINTLLAENTQENKQMAETVQYLVEERRQLQRKCEELESQMGGTATVLELEERCNHLLGRYLRVESHRKALVYQKRYLKVSLQSYQDSEQRALMAFNGGHLNEQQQKSKRKMFKTVALAIIAIQRLKYIGRIWHTGKRIVSKSVFTITQQKRSQAPTISCPSVTTTYASAGHAPLVNGQLSPPHKALERPLPPLVAPALLNGGNRTPSSAASNGSATAFEWPAKQTVNKTKKS